MRRRRPLVPSVFLGLCALVPAAASASYPAGVWGLVEKVTPGPDMMKPNQVRIDGVFMVANLQPDFPQYPGYAEPVYGYMYYECPADQLATCAMEWADLTAASLSDNNCRGWGDSSFKDNGMVRAWGEPQAKPDVWPISMGVVMGFTPCDALTMWVVNNPPPPMEGTTGGETSGMTDGTGGNETTGEATTGAPETSGGTSGPLTTGDATGTPDPTATGGTGGGETGGGGGTTGGGGGTTGGGGESGDGQDSGGGGSKDEGCGCRTERSGGHALGALAFGLGLAALRRRRR